MAAPSDPTDSPAGLQHALLEYLAAHPHACDTADGILEWWLQGSQVWSLAEVEHTLEKLVRVGILGRLPALDGRVRYRRAPGGA
jgi:Fe2+ or Zn2+ uptake regulation protein